MPGPCVAVSGGGLPARYPLGHPALHAVDRAGPVRSAAPDPAEPGDWSRDRLWPPDMIYALCVPLRARGRTLGVLTLLRGQRRPGFERADAVYAESMAALMAAALHPVVPTEG